MHSRENWDDFRFVLAVARLGSVSAAGKELGVNHATVMRRVAAFEERYAMTLFDKTVRGYRVAPGSQPILDALEEAENAVLGVGRAVSGSSAPLHGIVRVTSTDTFCTTILPEIVEELATTAPELQIDLISSNLHLDFGRLDADLTVRPSPNLPEELEGEAAADLAFAVYRARGSRPDRWLGLSGALARTPVAVWMAENVPVQRIIASTDSFLTMREMAASGRALAFIPSVLADDDARFEPSPEHQVSLSVPVWILPSRHQRSVPMLIEECSISTKASPGPVSGIVTRPSTISSGHAKTTASLFMILDLLGQDG